MSKHENANTSLSVVQPHATAETASTAVAAQAAASVQARYVMALQRPRNIDQVRVDLLKECKRPGFARVAMYHKPIGKGVTGPSIRFAEAAMRCMGNLMPEVATLYDDHDKRILRVSVTDLESNLTYSKDVTVAKTVERRKVGKGQDVSGTRLNSRGDTLYIVRATDDEILNKENALVSKALRTTGLRLIPGDILDEALQQVEQTSRDQAAKDPGAERKALVDAFAAVGVKPADLVGYLGHALEQTSPAEITKLRGIYSAMRDGEASWSDVVGDADPDDEPKESKTSRTKEALKKRREGKKAEPEHDQHEFDAVGPPPMTDEERAEVEGEDGAGF